MSNSKKNQGANAALTTQVLKLIGDDVIVPAVRFSSIINQRAVSELMHRLDYELDTIAGKAVYRKRGFFIIRSQDENSSRYKVVRGLYA